MVSLLQHRGKIKINGKVPYRERTEYVKNIGVVFGQRSQLWWDVPPDDSFYLLRDIYKSPKDEFESTRAMLVKALNLNQVIKIPTRQLSLRSKDAMRNSSSSFT